MTLRHTVVTRDEGTSFTVTTWPAADPGAPVLLVQPAMGMPASYYHRLGEQVAAAGMHAAVAELRGHEAEGGRIPSHSYDFGYADMLDDLDATVATVEERFPGSPVVLLGHSMGGQLGTAYVATHPGRIAGLVLIGSGTPYWRDFGWRALIAAPLFVGTSQALGHFPGKRFKFAGREARTMMRDWAGLAVTGRLPGATRAELDALTVPVLAYTIAGDWLAGDASVHGLLDLIPRADVTWEHLDEDGIDHFKWARRPDSVLPQILGWVRSAVGEPA
ncbi:MAG: alpha/beta fold hydrolase [Nocardioides sp.]|uniref:alpha/beta fold hydrolase n=1 Tax=Nocardioides sp. TaxID=35761 RepID=UPI0039E3FCBF